MADPDREKVLRERAREVCSDNLGCKDRHPFMCPSCDRILAALRQTAEEEHVRGIEDVLMIRCMEHFRVPQHNRAEIRGAECGECARAEGERAQEDRYLEKLSAAVDEQIRFGRAEYERGERAGREAEREECQRKLKEQAEYYVGKAGGGTWSAS